MMLPAIYVSGKVVTGSTHGDAFGKLSEKEKNSKVISGFYDPKKLKFIHEEIKLYLKKILLIRHADAGGFFNSHISDIGRIQAKMVAIFIMKNGFSKYQGFSSPILRCQETSDIIKNSAKVEFYTMANLSKKTDQESQIDFGKRIEKVLEELPQNSILVSHSDIIQQIIGLIDSLHRIIPIPNCSITYIENEKIVWLTKEIGIE